MELSKFTVGLIFIFLPGILALLVSERLTEHPERKGYELFTYALVLGCIAHVAYALMVQISHGLPLGFHLDEDRWIELMLEDETITIQTNVVATTAAIGVLLGLFLAYAANHSWLHRIAHDATVFENRSGRKLYDVKTIYLSFEKKDVAVEIF